MQQGGITIENVARVATHDALDFDRMFAKLPQGLVETTLTRLSQASIDEPLRTKLPVCLQWFRRAMEARRPEDKLLSSWIVLERAFATPKRERHDKWALGKADSTSKFRTIAEYVPFREALRLMYDFGWQLYHYLHRHLINAHLSGVALPTELQAQSGLETTSKIISLDQFIPKLPEIASHLSSRLVREKVQNAHEFYHDPAVARKEICRKHENTRDELILIYRLRNTIVHHGQFDRRVLVQFAARTAELARSVILLLFQEFLSNPGTTVESIFTDAKLAYDRTLARLKNNLPVELKPWGTYPRAVSLDEGAGVGSAVGTDVGPPPNGAV